MRYASAEVRKEFFTDMFTRDISLEDCVLDLIDNSIDSYLMKHAISTWQLTFGENGIDASISPGTIAVSCSERQIRITDTCGGISRQAAQHDIFCFGYEEAANRGRLGAYGVGMKRALFKIGNNFHMVSRTADEGFEASLDVGKWVQKEEWKIPIDFVSGSGSDKKAGTSITITELHEEVAQRIKQGGVPQNILRDAATTYPYFLDRCVTLSINDTTVSPEAVPLGEKDGVVRSANERFEQNGVRVTLVATIAPGQRTTEQAGWYILCNGRVVVRANKDDLTGWGSDLASFQPKYRSFVGLVSFESNDPLSLPWTTTKRGINRESSVFIRARALMAAMSKPILTALNLQYPSDPNVEADEIRSAVDGVRPVPFREIALRPTSGFSFTPPKKKERTTDRICFDAKIADLDKVRKHLRRPTMKPSDIGKWAFAQYVKNECAND
jgi:Histidine kinase-, DNA gyrase B-, and HSP90-like ATPase